MERVLILNPRAQGGRLWQRAKAYLQALAAEGVFVEATKGPGGAEILCRRALKQGAAEIISLGGDGTHHEVVNGFFEGSAPVNPRAIFFPLSVGTGSDLSRTLGRVAPDDLRRKLPVKTCDVGRLITRRGVRHFVNIADFGIGGVVVALVNRSSKRLGGFLTFLRATLRAGLTYRPRWAKVRWDGGERVLKIQNVVAANGRYFGGGMFIAPSASMQDGHLDLILMEPSSYVRGIKLLCAIYRGEHLSFPEIEHHRCTWVEAVAKGEVPIDADGEHGGRLPCRMEVVPGALRIRAPFCG